MPPLRMPLDGVSTRSAEGAVPLEEVSFPQEAADRVGQIGAIPSPIRHPLKAAAWLLRAGFGCASVIALLSVLAAIPILNFVAFGYLLEAQGRVAGHGQWRHLFWIVGRAQRLGVTVVGFSAWLLPLALLRGAAADARLLDPGGSADRSLHGIAFVGSLFAVVHLSLAIADGAQLPSFFRPIRNLRRFLRSVRDDFEWENRTDKWKQFWSGFRIRETLWLGLRGFLGSLLWLLLPTALLASLKQTGDGGQIVATLIGGILLIPVLAWLPILQVQFAIDGQWKSLFRLRDARHALRRAPVAWFAAVIVTYVLSFPLYLFKIILPPQDAMWGVTFLFILTIVPARLVAAWAYQRSRTNPDPTSRHWLWLNRLLTTPLLAAYVFFLFFTQTFGQAGKDVLFQHHALLLPSPF